MMYQCIPLTSQCHSLSGAAIPPHSNSMHSLSLSPLSLLREHLGMFGTRQRGPGLRRDEVLSGPAAAPQLVQRDRMMTPSAAVGWCTLST